MKPTGTMLGLAALLAFVLTTTTVRGEGTSDIEKTKDVKQQLDDIAKKLDLLINHNQADIGELRESLRKLDERVRALENLRDQLSTSARRNTRFSPSTSTSAYPPTSGGLGTIRLRNDTLVFAQVYLNGRYYNVPPLETVQLPNQPVGEFTYRVLADGFGEITPTLTRNLGANETYTITIYPR
jgi:hypothetical protein